MLSTNQQNRQDLHGEKERRGNSRQEEQHVQRSCDWRKPGTTEHRNRWNRDYYVIRLEGWAGADHIDHCRPQKGL